MPPASSTPLMRAPLEYARPKSPVRSLALPAFVCGLCSGPAVVGLGTLVAANDDSQTAQQLALFFSCVVLAGALAFGCIARARLPSGAPPRLRLFANLAVAAPIAWCIAILALPLALHWLL
jgi:hypothetical protein